MKRCERVKMVRTSTGSALCACCAGNGTKGRTGGGALRAASRREKGEVLGCGTMPVIRFSSTGAPVDGLLVPFRSVQLNQHHEVGDDGSHYLRSELRLNRCSLGAAPRYLPIVQGRDGMSWPTRRLSVALVLSPRPRSYPRQAPNRARRLYEALFSTADSRQPTAVVLDIWRRQRVPGRTD